MEKDSRSIPSASSVCFLLFKLAKNNYPHNALVRIPNLKFVTKKPDKSDFFTWRRIRARRVKKMPLCGVFSQSGAQLICALEGRSEASREPLGENPPHLKTKTSGNPTLFGRELGIRTPGPFQVNGFQDRRFRPLSQLSL